MKVFCYSKKEAKKNGNSLPIIPIVLSLIILIAVIIIMAVAIGEMKDTTTVSLLLIMVILFFTFIIVLFSVKIGLRLRSKLIGYVIDDNGKVYQATATNNGPMLIIGGVAAGTLLDQILNSKSNIGGELGGLVGAAIQIKKINTTAEYMSHPEIVSKIVENGQDVKGAYVYEIDKVYSVIEGKHDYKIKCNYRILGNNFMRNNAVIKIEKSYNNYEELINTIKNYK